MYEKNWANLGQIRIRKVVALSHEDPLVPHGRGQGEMAKLHYFVHAILGRNAAAFLLFLLRLALLSEGLLRHHLNKPLVDTAVYY